MEVVVKNSAVFVYLGVNHACMSSKSWTTNCTIGNIRVFIFLGVSGGPCHDFMGPYHLLG